MRTRLALTVQPGSFSVVRLGPRARTPAWALRGGLLSITRTASELSIVCRQESAPARARREDGFRCLAVAGPLPFDATGILSSLAAPLARARIPILAISTFDTDLLFVRGPHLSSAVRALERAGHSVSGAVE